MMHMKSIVNRMGQVYERLISERKTWNMWWLGEGGI